FEERFESVAYFPHNCTNEDRQDDQYERCNFQRFHPLPPFGGHLLIKIEIAVRSRRRDGERFNTPHESRPHSLALALNRPEKQKIQFPLVKKILHLQCRIALSVAFS